MTAGGILDARRDTKAVEYYEDSTGLQPCEAAPFERRLENRMVGLDNGVRGASPASTSAIATRRIRANSPWTNLTPQRLRSTGLTPSAAMMVGGVVERKSRAFSKKTACLSFPPTTQKSWRPAQSSAARGAGRSQRMYYVAPPLRIAELLAHKQEKGVPSGHGDAIDPVHRIIVNRRPALLTPRHKCKRQEITLCTSSADRARMFNLYN